MRTLLLAAMLAAAPALSAASLSSPSAASPDRPAKAGAASVPLAVTPLVWRDRTLANGLRVLAIENHDSPNVSVQVWYHVGSKDDPDGRSGFAHLFEHLMFKATKRMPAETFDRLTEDVGGSNNATTGDDRTNYFETVPSNHLQRLLWAEAERMANLDVNEANFKSERGVVKEEYRQRVLADPYGRLFNAIQANSYTVHPYRRPTIGNIAELDAASLADVIAFHQHWYRPDNATLIVVGDFDPAQLDGWVDQYFGAIQRPAAAIERATVAEPPRNADRRVTVKVPNVPLPAVALSWLAPPSASPDSEALAVASVLLGGGESSRLHQSLVYKTRIAQAAGFDPYDGADGGLLVGYAILASGHRPAEAEQAMLAEIRRLASGPISAAELDKAKTRLLTHEITERETNEGKGFALGEALIASGDPADANTSLARLQAVTAADVQRVLKTYVLTRNKVVIDYVAGPEATPEPAVPASPAEPAAATGAAR